MKNKLEFLSNQMAHRWEQWQARNQTHYVWDKYSIKQTPKYFWDKFNANQIQKYIWNKSSVKEDMQHIWGKYERIDTLIRTDYVWNKYNVSLIPRFPSWQKDIIDQDQIYVWNKYNAVVDEEASAIQNGEIQYHYTNGGTSYLKTAYGLADYSSSMNAKYRINEIHTMKSEYTFMSASAHSFKLSSSRAQQVIDGNEYNTTEHYWQRLYDEHNPKEEWHEDTDRPGYGWYISTSKAKYTYGGLIVRVSSSINAASGTIEYSEYSSSIEPHMEMRYSRPLHTFDMSTSDKYGSVRTYDDMTEFVIKPHYPTRMYYTGDPNGFVPPEIDPEHPGTVVWGPMATSPGVWSQRYRRFCGVVENINTEFQQAIQQILDNGNPCAYITIEVNPGIRNNSITNCYQDTFYGNDRAISYSTSGQMEAFQVFHSNYSLEYCADPVWAINPDAGFYELNYPYATIDGLTFMLSGHSILVSDPFEYPTVLTYCHLVDNSSVENRGLELWHRTDSSVYRKYIDSTTRQGLIPVSDINTYSITMPHPGPNQEQTYYLGEIVASSNITITGTPEITTATTIIPDTTIWDTTEAWVDQQYEFEQYNGLGKIHYLKYDPGTIYKPGTFVEVVKDKNRSAYPDNNKVDDYWYIYLRQQSVQPYLLQCSYTNEVDLTNWNSCSTRPVFDADYGTFSYTEGSGRFYICFLDENKNRYIEQLTTGGYLYWSSFANDGTQQYDYGSYVGAQRQNSQYYQQLDTVLSEDHVKGTYIAKITVEDNPTAHPQDGEDTDGYWYTSQGSYPVVETTRGDYIEDITYLNKMYYPMDGPMDDYWYTYKTFARLYSRGTPEGTVESTYSNAYPVDGINNGSWYDYVGTATRYEKGELLESIESLNADSFPQDGMQGYYWYTFKERTTFTEKDTNIGTVESTDNNKYPSNDVVGNYWYVFNRQYDQIDPVRYETEVWSDDRTAYPHDGAVDNHYYKYIGYKARPQYIIDDTLLKGGVKYQVDINSTEDYAPGDVACAEIQFTIFSEPEDAQKYLDLECDYYERMEDTDSWNLVGHFKVLDASDKTSTTTDLKAYDNIIKTEIDVDSVINGQIAYPIPLGILFTRICTACGLEGVWDQSAVNSSFQVKNNFTINGITGRQVLSLIAEVAAGFIHADPDGRIVCRGYLPNNSIAIDATQHTSSTQGIYETQSIGKLNVAMSTDDIGVSCGNGDVLYRIIGNPILYTESAEEIATPMQNIYNVLSNSSYTPTEVKVIDPAGIMVGDVIDVNGHSVWVQEITWDGKGAKIISKGKKERTIPTNAIDGSIDALRGKSNELTRTIDETNSRITDVQAGLQSEISQTATTINARITNVQSGLESQITQTAGTLNTRITNEKAALQSEITQTAGSVTSTVEAYTDNAVATAKTEIKQTTDSITSTVQSQGQTITQINQDLNGISLTYNSSTGMASLTIGNTTVTQLTDAGYVQRQVAGIDLTGYVTFHSLETYGETVINGSNITTGTINAARINMTGAISWSDLDSNVQGMITGGGGGSDIPAYIHSTYISSTDIYSPNIYGGIITAGTSSDGYIQMSSSGMNFVSSTGGSLIGMGYYSSNYNYPYIVFGQGVDAFGTDKGMIKKFSDGIWIGDSDCRTQSGSMPQSGTGIFIQFSTHKFYKYVNGTTVEF